MSWQIDPYHLQVEFAAKHLGMMTVRGHFTEATAAGSIDPDNPATSVVELAINSASAVGLPHPSDALTARSGTFATASNNERSSASTSMGCRPAGKLVGLATASRM